MPILTRVKPSEYHDSITLMLVAKALLELPGVEDAAVVMATPANREIVAAAGLLTETASAARPDDLLIAVRAVDEAAGQAALGQANRLLAERAPRTTATAQRPKSLASAIAAAPDANLAVISVAGRYAAREARTALESGLHVLLFSDNVPLEDEISLKRLAVERGLLCMGPDAGTAIINGVALGFANAVPRGRVGLVSASGTGLQGITCGLAQAGVGISQAIGTGGRDLSEPVGGLMMLAGLRALQDDPDTDVIVLISKPPAASVAGRIFAQIKSPNEGMVGDRPQHRDCSGRSPDRASEGKPTVVCFLGADPLPIEAAFGLHVANLTQAAAAASALARGDKPEDALARLESESLALIPLAADEQKKLRPGQAALRGLFAGGTFCYEAQLILKNLPEPVYSNAPLDKSRALTAVVAEFPRPYHFCIDLGEDEFTQGRLHPMIDPTLRNRHIVQAAHDPATAVILLDIVLGYGAHPDPAGAAVEAIREAQRVAAESGRHLIFIASVCGTEADPQPRSQQETRLRDADVIVLPDNASAARLAGLVTQAVHDR
jgi:succinyl-CoA synthetase alpha subunit